MKNVFISTLLILGTLAQSNVSQAWESNFKDRGGHSWHDRDDDWRGRDRDRDDDWRGRDRDRDDDQQDQDYNRTTYFCTVESTFDGPFSGSGDTRLEAQTNAMKACREGSRNDGFFCDGAVNCDSSN